MQQAERGCAVVTEHGKPIGVFTERDIVTRILGKNVSLDTKIADVMTTQPKLVRDGCSLPEVIRVMHEGGFRHLPGGRRRRFAHGSHLGTGHRRVHGRAFSGGGFSTFRRIQTRSKYPARGHNAAWNAHWGWV